MLSLEYITAYLAPNQKLIKKLEKPINSQSTISGKSLYDQYIINKKKTTYNLPESIKLFLNDKNSKYYVYKNIGKYHNYLFNFFKSSISSLRSDFILFDDIEKDRHIINFTNNMLIDLEEKNLYKIFKYNKIRKFKKSILQMILDHMVHKNLNIHNIYKKHLESIKIYFADYLKINIFSFYLDKTGKIDRHKSDYTLCSIYNETYNKYLPTILLYKTDEYYYPILSTESNCILRYSNDSVIIDKLSEYFYLNKINLEDTEIDEPSKNVEFNSKDLTKNKLSVLRKMSEDRGINIKKKSTKTGKMINKTKSELISELNK